MFQSLLSAVSITGGIALGARGVYLLHHAWDSHGWRHAIGSVLDSWLEDTGDGTLPHVRYEYEYLGHRYVSEQISVGGSASASVSLPFLSVSSSGRKMLNRYRPGVPINVYVNPKQPNDAVLERGFHLGSYTTLFAGMALVYLGIRLF